MRHRILRGAFALLIPGIAIVGAVQPLRAAATAAPTSWDEIGAEATNTPSGFATSAVAVGDLANDGNKRVVAAYMDGKVAAYTNAGGLLWSRQTGGAIHGSPALADIYGNGQLETIVTSGDGYVYIFLPDGRTATGWPQHDLYSSLYHTPPGFFSSAVVGDLWGDGSYEIVAGGLDHHLYAWYSDGTPMAGFPIDLYDTIWDTPSLASLEHDGHRDIVIGSDSSGGTTEPYPAGGVYWAFRPTGCGHVAGYSVGGTPQAGCMVPGWPRSTDQVPWASTAVADLNRTGRLDVIAGSGTYYNPLACSNGCAVNAFDQAGGTPQTGTAAGAVGWPQGTGAQVFGSPAVGDVTGNAALARQVFDTGLDGKLYGWGGGITGFPVNFGLGSLYSSPAVAPYDGSGRNGVWVCAGATLQAVDGTGHNRATYNLSGLCAATPTIADIGTGTLNVIVTASNGTNTWRTYMFPIVGARALPLDAYPTFKGSMYRTGEASVTPSAGAIQRSPLLNEAVAVRGDQNTIWVVPEGQGAYGYLGFPGQTGAAPAVVAYPNGLGGSMFIYIAVGTDGRMWERTLGSAWQLVTSAPHACLDSPAATTFGTTFFVTCVGQDRQLYFASAPVVGGRLPVAGAFNNLGGRVYYGPAVTNVGGTLQFMVVGDNNHVWAMQFGQPWRPTGWDCVGHPALGSGGGWAYFGCHGTDNQLWLAHTNTNVWGAAYPAGGILVDGVGLAVHADHSASAFVEGIRNSVWELPTDPGGTPTTYLHRGGVVSGIGAAGS